MHPLLARLQPLQAAEDIEAMTTLLEQWQPRDDTWIQCVEGRIFAPSSSATQRQRLRDVLHRFRYDRPASLATAGDGASALPAFGSATVDAADHVAALPVESSPSARAFAAFLGSVGSEVLRIGPPAVETDIEALQALAPARFSEQLLAFYRCIGSLEGTLGDNGIGLSIRNPRQLLDARESPLHWQRLGGLSLLDMARWSWGNDRPELERGALPDHVERATSQALCVGWLFDGYCEQHGYLLQRTDGRYQLHLWHQDDAFPEPQSEAAHAADLWVLLEALMRRIVPAQAGTPAIDSLSDLGTALERDAAAG